MTRKIKALGLALVAAFAISAVAASAASADAFHFGSTVEHAIIKGEQVGSADAITTDGGATTCSTINYDGTILSATKKTTEITINPTYSGCKFAGIANSATIDMNSCDFLFTAKTKESSNYEGEVHIKCTTPGDTITKTVVIGGVTKCLLHIPEQSLVGVTYTNVGSGSTAHIHVDINISGIKYSQTEGTGAGKCMTNDNTNNGTWVGTATWKGFDTANSQVGISVTPSL